MQSGRSLSLCSSIAGSLDGWYFTVTVRKLGEKRARNAPVLGSISANSSVMVESGTMDVDFVSTRIWRSRGSWRRPNATKSMYRCLRRGVVLKICHKSVTTFSLSICSWSLERRVAGRVNCKTCSKDGLTMPSSRAEHQIAFERLAKTNFGPSGSPSTKIAFKATPLSVNDRRFGSIGSALTSSTIPCEAKVSRSALMKCRP